MTNAEKFKQVFGIYEPPNDEWWGSDFHKINNNGKIKNRCSECKYLDLSQKTTVGYVCKRPNHRWITSTSHLKYLWTRACKAFEKRME